MCEMLQHGELAWLFVYHIISLVSEFVGTLLFLMSGYLFSICVIYLHKRTV